MKLYPKVEKLFTELENNLPSDERAKTLQDLANLILSVKEENGTVNLNFICTHNSRRSQIAELTMRTVCAQLGIDYITTYSGGTESTALNERVVHALDSLGFHIDTAESGENPVYSIAFDEESTEEPAMFSKVYDHPSNPDKNMVAVIVCGDAEENCPFIPGADHRFALKYVDPKHSDNSPEEAKTYENKVKEIGSEMIFLANLLK